MESNSCTQEKGIFISYDHEDEDVVSKIVEKLKISNQVMRINNSQLCGDTSIEEGINGSSTVVCFISKKYINSSNCRREFFYAHKLGKICLHVALERIDKNEATGMTIYLYGESIWINAYELDKTNSIHEYANKLYLKIESALKSLAKHHKDDNDFQIRDNYFVGRENIFDEMDKKGNKKIMILHGLPGIGKTSISIEYMYRKLEDKTYKKAYWFSADSKNKINELLYLYGTKLHENETPSPYDRIETIDIFIRFIHYSTDVLLVFDNVEDLNDVKNAINIDQVKCRTLITTRNDKVVSKNATMIDIPPFGIDESKQYIKLRFPGIGENRFESLWEEISINNECLPYKIVMITAGLSNDPTLRSDATVFNMNDTYMEAVLTNLELKCKHAVELLRYAMIIDPDHIPGKLIEKILSSDNCEAIKAISNQNLCKIVFRNSDNYGISIHRLFQDDLKGCLTRKEETDELIVNNLLKILEEEFPETDYSPDATWIKADMYFRHLNKLEELIPNNADIAAKLYCKLSLYRRFVLRDYDNAISNALKAFEYSKKNNSSNDATIAKMYNYYIGSLYSTMGKEEEALRYYELSFDLYKKIFETDQPEIATVYHNMGASYSQSGNDRKALDYFFLSIEIKKKFFKDDNHDIALTYNYLGIVYSNLGDEEKALEYFLLSLEIRSRLFKGDHTTLAMSYNNIGSTYDMLGEHKKAFEYYTIALEMRERLFKGIDHFDTAMSYNNIGCSYSRLGEEEKSLEYKMRSLEMRKRLANGGDHFSVANSYQSMGGSCIKLGNYEKALEYHMLALEMRKRLFKDKDHIRVAWSYNDIGYTYSYLRDEENTFKYYTLSGDMLKRLYGEHDHPRIANLYKNMGVSYLHFRQPEKALENHKLALEMNQRLFKQGHPDIVQSYEHISSSYSALGDEEKALEYKKLLLSFKK